MISIGQNRANERALATALTTAYSLDVRVQLLDLDHTYKDDLSPYFLDGQVTVDADATDATRALDLTLLDPFHRVQLDPDGPGGTAAYIADMIRVVCVVSTPQRAKPWEIPVFCGPISGVTRDDTTVSIKALGKESLAMTNLWKGRTFKKGQEKTWVIKQILTDLMGESRMDIPNRAATLPNDQKLNSNDAPWKVVKNLANSMGMQLFYDGRGVCVMRPRRMQRVLTIDQAWLIDKPSSEYDLSTVINAVRVIGGKPKKAKKNVKAKAVAQRSHKLSPWNLGRTVNGNRVPRFLWMEVQDDSLRTTKECKDLANKLLKHGLIGGVSVNASGIPHYALQEMDVVTFKTDNIFVTLPLRKFTIPLLVTNAASYGYHRPLRTRKPHIKHRHHRHARRAA